MGIFGSETIQSRCTGWIKIGLLCALGVNPLSSTYHTRTRAGTLLRTQSLIQVHTHYAISSYIKIQVTKSSQNQRKLPAKMDSSYNKIFDSPSSSPYPSSYPRYCFYDNEPTSMEEVMICSEDMKDFPRKKEPKKSQCLGFMECFEFLRSLVS
ncbi:Uncharacterized protein Fot_03118 [Forsythia ovata]|uniref:Uncharacterized protein n=1 Tax=Forsythia ovata TaxID=205694 RepID=A0ABD1X8Y3_9LAMI